MVAGVPPKENAGEALAFFSVSPPVTGVEVAAPNSKLGLTGVPKAWLGCTEAVVAAVPSAEPSTEKVGLGRPLEVVVVSELLVLLAPKEKDGAAPDFLGSSEVPGAPNENAFFGGDFAFSTKATVAASESPFVAAAGLTPTLKVVEDAVAISREDAPEFGSDFSCTVERLLPPNSAGSLKVTDGSDFFATVSSKVVAGMVMVADAVAEVEAGATDVAAAATFAPKVKAKPPPDADVVVVVGVSSFSPIVKGKPPALETAAGAAASLAAAASSAFFAASL